jgi:putative ABC transport system permease protein
MQPPKKVLAFLRWFCHEDYLEEIEGDLTEVFKKQYKNSPRKAKWKFGWSVIKYFRPEFMKSFRNSYQPNSCGMYKSYFKIGWRNILKTKIFSTIKILSLSIGLSVCMLIFLYIKDEITYDQFHEHKARLYRITRTFVMGDNPHELTGITNAVVGETFAREIPDIQQCVRINSIMVTVKKGNEVFMESPLAVDENFFSVFTFPLRHGDIKTALGNPMAVVLSEKAAKKYFGKTDALGKTVEMKLYNEFELFTVTAIMEDPPANSTFKPDLVVPFQYAEKYNDNQGWTGGSVHTFVLLSHLADVGSTEEKMQALFDKHASEEIMARVRERGEKRDIFLGLQPLTQIHLNTREAEAGNGLVDRSDPVYSYILTCIAAFILVIACINFINLSIAQSLKRSKEIGIRKVAGSTRKQLMMQFFTETFLVSAAAFTIALILTVYILPFFNVLSGKKLSLSYLSDGYLWVGYFLLLLATSVISGIYPLFILSAFKPMKSLYGKQILAGKNYLTKSLLVLQFSLTIILIVSTITIYTQLHYILNANLGFNSKDLVKIDIPINKSSDLLPEAFKRALAHESQIISIAAKNGGRSITSVKVGERTIAIENNKIDDRFLPTLEIAVVAGRNFSTDHPSDVIDAVLVNERFVKEVGWETADAVGKAVSFVRNRKSVTIVGVVSDYHFSSLKEPITPALYSMDPGFDYGQIWVKIKSDDIPYTLRLLERTYKDLVPYFPYSYEFMEDIHTGLYETETTWKQIITMSSLLFIFISCTGLFGLSMLTVEKRTKEISIRKVLGASVGGIVQMLSSDFVKLILLSIFIGSPVAWIAMNRWLEHFAYRIDIEWWMFVLAGMVTVVIALLTVSLQAVRAALVNPINSLRSD